MARILLSITMISSIGVFVVMALIVRDVMPRLSDEERLFFRQWMTHSGKVKFDRALRNAWNLHVQWYPNSRKRVLLACTFSMAILSVVSYPLWIRMN